jgi:hypothetical protein
MTDIEQARELLAEEYRQRNMQNLTQFVETGFCDPVIEGEVAAIAAALRAAPEVIELRLRETRWLLLKPDQLYRFTVDSDCDACNDAAAAAKPALATVTTPPKESE